MFEFVLLELGLCSEEAYWLHCKFSDVEHVYSLLHSYVDQTSRLRALNYERSDLGEKTTNYSGFFKGHFESRLEKL